MDNEEVEEVDSPFTTSKDFGFSLNLPEENELQYLHELRNFITATVAGEELLNYLFSTVHMQKRINLTS